MSSSIDSSEALTSISPNLHKVMLPTRPRPSILMRAPPPTGPTLGCKENTSGCGTSFTVISFSPNATPLAATLTVTAPSLLRAGSSQVKPRAFTIIESSSTEKEHARSLCNGKGVESSIS